MMNSTAAQNVVPTEKPTPWVPKNTLLYTSLNKSLNAEKVKAGDAVDFRLLEATLIQGKVVPANATLHGKVLEANGSDRNNNKDSRLGVVVDSITWKHNSLPVCASIVGFGARRYTFSGEPMNARSDAQSWTVQPGSQNGTMGRSAFSDSPQAMPGGLPVMPGSGAGNPFAVGETNVVITGEQYVRDLYIYRSPNSASVLLRRDKNIHLPGGLLVALEELPTGEKPCPAPVSQ